MPDSFMKVIQDINNKMSIPENVKSVPCKVIELLDNEKVKVEVISSGANYIVLNRCGNDVQLGENVSLFYHGDIINSNQAYIGAAINKRSDKYYTKPETDDMLNGMSIEKISKADYDSLLVKNPNRVYFVYDTEGSYEIYIGDSKISGEGGGCDHLPVYVRAKISEYIEADLSTTFYETEDVSDICEIASRYLVYGNPIVEIKPRKECLCVLFVCAAISSYPGLYDTLTQQGWELFDSVGLTNSKAADASVVMYSQVYTKRSDGGTVRVSWERNLYDSRSVTVVCLYGATSLTTVQSGNMPLQTHSWETSDPIKYHYKSGFSIPATTGKYRVIGCSNDIFGPTSLLSDTPFNAYAPEPDQYIPTLSTNYGIGYAGITHVYFDTNSNNGLYYYGWNDKNSDIEPSEYNINDIIGTKQLACHVFDVNY